MQIKCIGRRRIDVVKEGDKIGLKITINGNYVAMPVLEINEAIKLIGELNAILRFEYNYTGQK